MKKGSIRVFHAALLALILSSCANLPENLIAAPELDLRDIDIVGVGFNNQTVLLSFDISNSNPFPLPVRNIAYDVRLDGQRFASGTTDCEFTVPAGGDSSFAISVELDLLRTAPQLLTIIRDGANREIVYDLSGQLGVDIPLTPALRYRDSGRINLGSGSL